MKNLNLNLVRTVNPTFTWNEYGLRETSTAAPTAEMFNRRLRELVALDGDREMVLDAMLDMFAANNLAFCEHGPDPKNFLNKVLDAIYKK